MNTRTPHTMHHFRGTFGVKSLSCYIRPYLRPKYLNGVLIGIWPPTDRSRPKGLKNLRWQSHKAHTPFEQALDWNWSFSLFEIKPGAQQSSRGRSCWKPSFLAMLSWGWLRPAEVRSDPRLLLNSSNSSLSSTQQAVPTVWAASSAHPSSQSNLHLSKCQPTNKSCVIASFQLLNYVIFLAW